MNLIWTAWTAGDTLPPTPVLRATDPSRYIGGRKQTSMIRGLVPFSTPEDRGAFVDALTSAVLTGPLRDKALEFDPVNSYEVVPIRFSRETVDWETLLQGMTTAVSMNSLVFRDEDTRSLWEESPIWVHRAAAFILETAFQVISEA